MKRPTANQLPPSPFAPIVPCTTDAEGYELNPHIPHSHSQTKGNDMSKILKRDVKQAHDKYASEAMRWGDDNLATVRALVKYHEVRKAWEEQTGKSYL